MNACCTGCSVPFSARPSIVVTLAPFLHHRERQARIDAAAVNQDGARAALAVIAALLGAGQIEMIAQGIEKRGPRCDAQLALHAVDRDRDCDFPGHRRAPLTISHGDRLRHCQLRSQEIRRSSKRRRVRYFEPGVPGRHT
jgi:hypothetical protein